MITFKNKTTGESVNVYDIKNVDGVYVSSETGGREKGAKFIAKYAGMLTEGRDEDGKQYFTLSEGWEVVKTPRQTKPTNKPKPAHKPTKPAKPQEEAVDVVPVADNVPNKEDEVAAPVETTTDNEGDNIAKVREQLLSQFGQLGAGIFDAVCKVATNQPTNNNGNGTQQHEVTIVTTDNGQHEVTGKTCKNFDALCVTVKKNIPLYLWGEAGTGKSHTCKQIAEALGLEYYPMQQLLYAHEVVGYATADGSLVETPFYKAFTQGGLVDLEEFDSSSPEAALVINGAIANGLCNFPVVGVKEAHPDFRVIATGNTCMSGADTDYTGRSVMDASTVNRFMFVKVGYDNDIEDSLTNGDLTISNFCRDLRNAKNRCNISLCVSYRSIKMLADVDMQQVWGAEELLRCSLFKGLLNDELRMIYQRLTDKENRWAVAMSNLIR